MLFWCVRLLLRDKLVGGAYEYKRGPWTLRPSYYFLSKAAIEVRRKLEKSSIVFKYTHGEEEASLSWEPLPFKVRSPPCCFAKALLACEGSACFAAPCWFAVVCLLSESAIASLRSVFFAGPS